MRINKSVEQGILVLLILTLQKNHEALKSSTISHALGVSDSYLKKVLRKLVVSGLIRSNASKDGGFSLAKPLREITVRDVVVALDTEIDAPISSPMVSRIFDDQQHVEESVSRIRGTFDNAMQSYLSQLNTLRLSELVREEFLDIGYYDWNTGKR